MSDRPSTMPGKTSGSDAMLSSSHRPGILVLTTIQQITDVTSMTTVAEPNESRMLFQTVLARSGYVKMNR